LLPFFKKMINDFSPEPPLFSKKKSAFHLYRRILIHCFSIITFLFFGLGGLGQPRVISTFAGNGIRGYSGNGGPALMASIKDVQNICSDRQGNIYIADYGNYVIRKVNNSGIISVYAGTGESGYTGDGGQATLAKIGIPYGICTDDQGNVYFSDVTWDVIRKITPGGIITTIGGKLGTPRYSGDGGPATEAGLSGVCGISIDKQGNLFIAEFGNNVIRKISNTGIISTVAGTGNVSGNAGNGGLATKALLFSPTGVTVDKAGNLYIADMGNNVIRKVGTDGIILNFAGTGFQGYTGD